MSDGTPDDPTRRPMPWEAKPDDPGSHAPTPPGPEGSPGADAAAPADATPTEIIPTPDTAPLEPPAQAGLISAAPVGWGAAPAPTVGLPPPTDPTAPGSPTVGWAAPPPSAPEVPGAPGLSFADTISRLVGYVIDAIIIGIVAGIVAAIFGFDTTTVTRNVGGSTATAYVGVGYSAIPYAIGSLLYFVFFWTGGRRATPGQRVFSLQVGNAFDGRGLTLEQAVRRWLGYGTFLGLFALIPGVGAIASGVEFLWIIVLIITTATSPTKQGLHDRFANTAVVRPTGQGSRGLAMACLIVILILVILPVLAILALLLVGGQVSTILSEVGSSI